MSEDADWGSPIGAYDIKVTKKGSKLDTEYTVTPIPKSPVSDEIKSAFKAANVNLQALFTNGDPFASAQPAAKPEPVVETKSFMDDDMEQLPF